MSRKKQPNKEQRMGSGTIWVVALLAAALLLLMVFMSLGGSAQAAEPVKPFLASATPNSSGIFPVIH